MGETIMTAKPFEPTRGSIGQAVSVKPLGLEWLEVDNMIYNIVDADSGWHNGKRPQINQYMIRFSRQLSAGGSDGELDALQARVLSAITTQPAAELAKLRKMYEAACGSADTYKASFHAALEQNDTLAAEVRNAALQEVCKLFAAEAEIIITERGQYDPSTNVTELSEDDEYRLEFLEEVSDKLKALMTKGVDG